MVFYICCHCYRGQRYCSSRCREKSRRQQRREANRRYERSLGPEGREDHRARQREYRQRLKRRVTDQSSPRPSPRANLGSAADADSQGHCQPNRLGRVSDLRPSGAMDQSLFGGAA